MCAFISIAIAAGCKSCLGIFPGKTEASERFYISECEPDCFIFLNSILHKVIRILVANDSKSKQVNCVKCISQSNVIFNHINSETLGIFEVEMMFSKTINCVLLANVTSKAIVLPFKKKYLAIPILHTHIHI
jgi:hypothetical protein